MTMDVEDAMEVVDSHYSTKLPERPIRATGNFLELNKLVSRIVGCRLCRLGKWLTGDRTVV
ncbi:hypothetical protein AS026_20725 [Rhizobium altiplani]|uniref:Uncharacterized protein n=1 Tax=Rhizobium altiplani TaxID=1864509 RepID=A0A109J4X5_9HYPH|nr:hypothetical protein AS026_20725 [Rhizobium altiplani]